MHEPHLPGHLRARRESPYWDWFFIEGERSSFAERNYKTFADVPCMPKLNTDNDAVIDYFCGVGRYWIREFGADGWRLDVSDEISMRFLRRFREAVKAENADAIIIGEVWHGAAEFLGGDMYDGVMNYGLTKAWPRPDGLRRDGRRGLCLPGSPAASGGA